MSDREKILMRITPNHEGYKLFHDGTLALSQVESNGIRIDMDYLRHTRKALRIRCNSMQQDLLGSKVWRLWRRRYGEKSSLGSGDQLGNILFRDMGYKQPKEDRTSQGRFRTDDATLSKTKDPFVLKYLRWKKLTAINGGKLAEIQREVCDGFIHPNYNLNLVITYRSSSDNPNFQNYHVRDKELSEIVRRCFIPRKGCALVENDFKGLEVGTAACYCLDPVLIKYVKDPTLDMHRDMAMEIYKLGQKYITKDIRYLGKNGFVFPEFYGDWYKSVAPVLWEAIKEKGFKGPDGKSLYRHLHRHGIKRLGECDYEEDPVKGTFEYHIKRVEHSFWKERFKVYDQWKRQWYSKYLKCGYFDSLTGFRYEGVFDRKQTSNYPIQGSGFHCTLWSLIQAQREQNRNRVGRLTVGQIHDSVLTDVPIKELDDHHALMKDIVERRLPRHWKWIVVPMKIETEIAGAGKTWFDKVEVKI